MNRILSNCLFYYPATLLKGEPIIFLMKSYKDRQWLSIEKIREYQLDRLKKIVQFAYHNSDFYRKRFMSLGLEPDSIKNLEDISKFPLMTKRDLIENLDEIKSNKQSIFSVSKTTGGSTGEPVKLYKNALALARERCATARSYEWANINPGDSQLRFWGIPHSEVDSKKARLTDIIANRKRISAFDINERSLQAYYDLAHSFRPSYIYGYVSAVQELANFIITRNLKPIPSVKSVVTTSEILTDTSRYVIERAFGTRVYNEYGCGEVGSIAHQCSEGNMHVMADNLYVEVDGEKTGELIVTDLFNTSTPIIRYRLGDYGTISDEQCSCGRGLPLIEKIHGRAYDLVKLPNGNKVHPESIIYVFEAMQSKFGNFRQFQVVQETRSEVAVKIIPNSNWKDVASSELINNLKANVCADLDYRIDLVEAIEREKSGKMRLVKCML